MLDLLVGSKYSSLGRWVYFASRVVLGPQQGPRLFLGPLRAQVTMDNCSSAAEETPQIMAGLGPTRALEALGLA